MPLDVFLARAAARMRLRDGFRAIAAGGLAAAICVLVLRVWAAPAQVRGVAGLASFAAIAAGTFVALRPRRSPRAAAAVIEQHEPSLRNLLITAEQLRTDAAATRPYMRERVLAQAGKRAGGIDLGRAVPLRRDLAAVAGALGIVVFATAAPLPAASSHSSEPSQVATSPDSRISNSSFAVDLVPPAYSGRPQSRLTDPTAIEVLAGTRGRLRFADGASVNVRINNVSVPVSSAASAETTFTESGYIAIRGDALERLVPVTVIPDRVPEVKITAPAKDLRVASSAASIPVAAEAADDLGLDAFDVRYTIVSGTGEQFSFTEGTLPAKLVRTSDRAWRLETTLSLASLKLEPGDALIYRAVAADRRPGDAGIASSDTFFVEIAGPGDVPLEGVDMPPDKERYALSEAMIVLKIERLQAREASMPRERLVEAAGNIAAEQRAVRANFIFLLGGEVEDEEVEAEASHEISEGRFANQARREIVNATVLMARVEKALGAVSTREALPLAREAVKALQRAFGHSRYLLRALPSRARIDPARRLSGDASGAIDWSRALTPAAPDTLAETARAALADLASLDAGFVDSAQRDAVAARLTEIAERLLSGPARADLQPVVRELIASREAFIAGRLDQARAALRRAAAPLVSHAQRGRIDGDTRSRDLTRLSGAATRSGGRQ